MSRKEAERPVVGVLGYGSLLAPEELDDLLADGAARAVPVRVEGFRRLFNQEASWRQSKDTQRAVLNAVRDESYEMNAVLMPDLSRAEYSEIRERESGYRMVEVRSEAIETFDINDEQPIDEHDVVLIATGTKVNDDIEPIPEYVEICLEGARAWGEKFYETFVNTTEIQAGEPLNGYLETR